MEINATLFGQLITFAILVWFTMRYIWPPITKGLHLRAQKIAEGLAATDRAKTELEHATHKALSLINEAKRDAAHIMETAHKRSVQTIEEAKQAAHDEGQRLIERAKSEIEREVHLAKDVMRQQLVALSVKGAEIIIRKQLKETDQAALLDELVNEI